MHEYSRICDDLEQVRVLPARKRSCESEEILVRFDPGEELLYLGRRRDRIRPYFAGMA